MSTRLADTEKRDGGRVCALCGRPQAERFRPFCSKRCADLDLSRWLSGGYAIPAEEEETPDGEAEE
jgi:endogenous inhibitor of DNA gyrase (YacG/DUF329 family)